MVLLLIAALLLTTLALPSAEGSEWQGEETIDLMLKETHSPQVAVDAQGRAIAIWYQDVGVSTHQYRLHASKFLPGEGWGTPVMIQNGDYNVNRYALDVSPDGTVVIVHLQGYSMMHVRTFEIGSGWGTDQLVYSAQGINTYFGDLQLEMNSHGGVILAWTERYEGYDSLRAMLRTEGDWGEAQVIAEGSNEISEINAVLSDQGDAMAAWNVRTGDFAIEVWASNYTAGGWSAPEKISAGDDYSGSPRLGMDGNGNAVVVWSQRVAENIYNVYGNNFSAGSGWSVPINIQNGTDDSRAPRVAMNAAGDAVAVWQQNYGGKLSLTANVYVPGTGWQGAERLENGNWGGSLPEIGLAENGDAIVVWVPESAQGIRSLQYSEREGWGPSETIQTNTGWVENLDIDVGKYGSAVVVWEQDNDVHSMYLPAELHLILDEPLDGSMTDSPTIRVSGWTNPGAELRVNGIYAHVNTVGEFSLNVSLNEGSNAITVTSSTPYDEESINLTVERSTSEEDVGNPDEEMSPLMLVLGLSGWVVAVVAIVVMVRSKRLKN